MILVVAVIAAFILFFSIVLVSINASPRNSAKRSALIAVDEILKLDSMSIKNVNRMFDGSEYRALKENPALAQIAGRLRKDRQQLALTWLSLLRKDLKKLFRFHSFLIRGGVPAELGEELEILYTLVWSLLFLAVLKSFVRVCGPFAFHGVTHRARLTVQALCHASAKLLSKLPSNQWQDIAQNWQRFESALT